MARRKCVAQQRMRKARMTREQARLLKFCKQSHFSNAVAFRRYRTASTPAELSRQISLRKHAPCPCRSCDIPDSISQDTTTCRDSCFRSCCLSAQQFNHWCHEGHRSASTELSRQLPPLSTVNLHVYVLCASVSLLAACILYQCHVQAPVWTLCVTWRKAGRLVPCSL